MGHAARLSAEGLDLRTRREARSCGGLSNLRSREPLVDYPGEEKARPKWRQIQQKKEIRQVAV